jgi:hypothetical protein
MHAAMSGGRWTLPLLGAALGMPYLLVFALTPWAGPPFALMILVLWCRGFATSVFRRAGKRRTLTVPVIVLLANTFAVWAVAVALLWR